MRGVVRLRRLAVALGTLVALYVLATHLLGWGGTASAALGDRAVIATYAGAAFLGLFNLGGIHLRRVAERRRGWGHSLLLLGALLGYGAVVVAQSPQGPTAAWVFLHVLSPLYATMYGLVAFLAATSLGVPPAAAVRGPPDSGGG